MNDYQLPVVLGGRRNLAGVDRALGVRFTVPSHYGDACTDGRWDWPTFEEAVTAARSTIETLDYGRAGRRDSRAFVALRQGSRYAAPTSAGSGVDEELLRWEVFRDRVVLQPPGRGLTDAESDAARAFACTEGLA